MKSLSFVAVFALGVAFADLACAHHGCGARAVAFATPCHGVVSARFVPAGGYVQAAPVAVAPFVAVPAGGINVSVVNQRRGIFRGRTAVDVNAPGAGVRVRAR